MKFVFLILLVLCYCNSKFNISIILNTEDDTITSKRDTYLKVGSLFRDYLDIEFSNSHRDNSLFISTGLKDFRTKSSTIYSRRLLKAFCEENYMYTSLIYSAVDKCILIYLYNIGIYLMIQKEKNVFIIVGSEDDQTELGNLRTYIKQFGKECMLIYSIAELKTLLSSYNQEKSSKVVIFNFYYYKTQFGQLFNELSKLTYKDDISVISYFVEMDYIEANPVITSNTYIVTQYLEKYDEFKLKEMISNKPVDNTIYLTYLTLYFVNSTISLFYLKDVNELSNKMERMLEISNIKKVKYLNNNFIIPNYIIKVENGIIIEEYDLYCDSYIYVNDLWYNPSQIICNNGVEEKVNFIEIGYMGKIEHLHYNTILRGIYESIDYTNSENYFSFDYLLKIVIAPYSMSIQEQYNYLLTEKVSVIIYYISTDMLDDLLPVINENDPYLFTIGYNSGEICYPNIFHIGTNIPTQIHFYNYFYPDKLMFLLYSNTPYGIKSNSYIQRYYTNLEIEISSLMINSATSKSTDDTIKSFLNNYDSSKEMHLLCALGEEYTISFIKEFEKYKNTYPKLNIFILDLVDDIYDSVASLDLSDYWTININPLNHMNSSEEIADPFKKYHKNKSFTYYEFLSTVSIYFIGKLIDLTNSTDRILFDNTIYTIGLHLDRSNISITHHNYLILRLRDFKLSSDDHFIYGNALSKQMTQFPSFISMKGENGIYDKMELCDWNSPNYRKTVKVTNILCISRLDINSICDLLFQIYESSRTDDSGTEFFVIKKDLPIFDDSSSSKYVDKVNEIFGKYNPDILYGHMENKEKYYLLNEVLPKYNCLFFDMNGIDNIFYNDYYFSFGKVLSDFVEATIPDFLFTGNKKIFYISTSYGIDQSRILSVFNRYYEFYKSIHLEYEVADLKTEILDDIVDRITSFKPNVIMINLYEPINIIEEINKLNLQEVYIFHLRKYQSFLSDDKFLNHYQFIYDYIPNKDDYIYTMYQNIRDSNPERSLYDVTMFINEVYGSNEMYRRSLTMSQITYNYTLKEALENTKLKLNDQFILSFNDKHIISNPISVIKRTGKEDDDNTIFYEPFIEFESSYDEGLMNSTICEMKGKIRLGLIISSKTFPYEAEKLLFMANFILVSYKTICFYIYDIEETGHNVDGVINYFKEKEVSVFYGIMLKNDIISINDELEREGMYFFYLGFPIESDICYKNIYQLQSISDYIGFISYSYYESSDTILLLDDTPSLQNFHSYLVKCIEKSSIQLNFYYFNKGNIVDIIVKHILKGLKINSSIILSTENSKVTEKGNFFIKIISEFKLNKKYKLHILNPFDDDVFKDAFSFKYSLHNSLEPIRFPLARTGSPNNFGSLLQQGVELYIHLDPKDNINDIKMTYEIQSHNISFNKYHIIEHPIYLFYNVEMLFKLPSNSIIYSTNLELLELNCRFSNGTIIKPITRKNILVLIDDEFDTLNIIKGIDFGLVMSKSNSKNLYNFIPYYIYKEKNITSAFEELFKMSKIFIGLTTYKYFQKISPLFEDKEAVLYFLGQTISYDCLMNNYFMNINLNSLFLTYVSYINYNCDSVIVLFPENLYAKSDINRFMDELKYHRITINEFITLSDNAKVLSNSLIEYLETFAKSNNCILNFLSHLTNKFVSLLDSHIKYNSPLTVISFYVPETIDMPVVHNFTHLMFIMETWYYEDEWPIIDNLYYNKFMSHYTLNNRFLQSYATVLLVLEVSDDGLIEDNYESYLRHHLYKYLPYNTINYMQSNNHLFSKVLLAQYIGFNEETSQFKYEIYKEMYYTRLSVNPIRSLYSCNWYEGFSGNNPADSIFAKFGFLITMSDRNALSDFDIFLSVLTYAVQIQNIFMTKMISYEMYDIGSSNNRNDKCLKGLKTLLDHDNQHIFYGKGTYKCLVESQTIIDEYKNKDFLIYYPHNSPGLICNSKIITVGGLPNQFYKATLYHFVSTYNDLRYVQAVYDNTNYECLITNDIFASLLNSSPDYYAPLAIEGISPYELGQLYVGAEGLLFLIFPTGKLLSDILDIFTALRITKTAFVCLLMQTEEDLSFFHPQSLKDTYILDTTFSTLSCYYGIDDIVNTSFSPSAVQPKMSTVIRYSATIVMAIFEFIQMFVTEPSVMRSYFYQLQLLTCNGEQSLYYNNYFRHNVRIAKIGDNMSIKVVYESFHENIPNPFAYSTSSDIPNCDFNYGKSEKVLHVLISTAYSFERLFSHFIYFYADSYEIDSIIGYEISFSFRFGYNDVDCSNSLNQLNDNNYDLMILLDNGNCNKLLEEYNENKPIWLVSNYPTNFTNPNIFISGIQINNIIRPVLLELNIIYPQRPIIFIIDPKFSYEYERIKNILPEFSMDLIDSIEETDINSILTKLNPYLQNIEESGIHLFIEQKTSVIRQIIKNVNDLTNNNTNELVDFISFITYPITFIEDPYFIRIGTFLHTASEEEKNKFPSFFKELDHGMSNGYPSLYFSYFISLHFWRNAIKLSGSTNYTIYKPYLYAVVANSAEGKVTLNLNNEFNRNVYIAFSKGGQYREYNLGYIKTFRKLNQIDEEVIANNCTLYNCANYTIKPIKVGLILPILNSLASKHDLFLYESILKSFYYIFKYLLINPQFESHYEVFIAPYLSFYNIDNYELSEYINESYKKGTSFFITDLDYIDESSLDNINDNVLIFNLGYGYENYKYPIFSLGASLSTIANNVYLNIMKYSQTEVYILYHSDLLFSTTITNYMQTLFYSSGVTVTPIFFEKGSESILTICLSVETCAVINTVPFSISRSYYEFTHDKEDIMKNAVSYCVFMDEPLTPETVELMKYIYILDVYFYDLNSTTFSFLTDTTDKFKKNAMKYFPLNYLFLPNIVIADDALRIYFASVERNDDFNVSTIKRNLMYHEFESATGRTSFSSNMISRDLFTSQSTGEKMKIIDYKDMYSLSRSMQKSDEYRNINIGFILDYGENEEILSKNLVLLSDALLSLENEKYSPQNISFFYSGYPLYRNEFDIYTIRSLFSNVNITAFVGCTSFYCYNLVINEMNTISNNKIFFSLLSPPDIIQSRYIISIQEPTIMKLNFFITRNANIIKEYVVLVDKNTKVITSKIRTLLTKVKIRPIIVDYPFDTITTKEFFETYSRYTVLNILSSENLKRFEIEIVEIQRSIHSKLNQVIFYFDEFQIGNEILSELTGNLICTTIKNDDRSNNIQLFNDFLIKHIGKEMSTSQLMVTFEATSSIIINSLTVAIKKMKEDNCENETSKKRDYIQMATHESCESYTLGILHSSNSNRFFSTIYVGEINSLGSINHIYEVNETNMNSELINEEYSFGRFVEYFRFSNALYILAIVMTVIVILTGIVFLFLLAYFNVPHSLILIYLLLSCCFVVITSLFLNFKYSNDKDCMAATSVLYISVINFLSLLMFRVQRLSNILFAVSKRQISPEYYMIVKILIIDICYAAFTLIYSLIKPFSKYSPIFNESLSDYITDVYNDYCVVDVAYAVLTMIFTFFIISFGYYYSWKCKRAKKTTVYWNHLFSCTSWCCLMILLYVAMNVVTQKNDEILYISNNLIAILFSYFPTIYLFIYPIYNTMRGKDYENLERIEIDTYTKESFNMIKKKKVKRKSNVSHLVTDIYATKNMRKCKSLMDPQANGNMNKPVSILTKQPKYQAVQNCNNNNNNINNANKVNNNANKVNNNDNNDNVRRMKSTSEYQTELMSISKTTNNETNNFQVKNNLLPPLHNHKTSVDNNNISQNKIILPPINKT